MGRGIVGAGVPGVGATVGLVVVGDMVVAIGGSVGTNVGVTVALSVSSGRVVDSSVGEGVASGIVVGTKGASVGRG